MRGRPNREKTIVFRQGVKVTATCPQKRDVENVDILARIFLEKLGKVGHSGAFLRACVHCCVRGVVVGRSLVEGCLYLPSWVARRALLKKSR